MIKISLDSHRELYTDYTKCLNFLANIDYSKFSYPNEKTFFHLYCGGTGINNEKQLLSIKSFFATQNLDKTKLILWSDIDIQNSESFRSFKDQIDFRIWNPIEEAKGTVLEDKNKILKAADNKYYLQSDLLRILALKKHGGIWFDFDMVLLRDFKPLLDQEFMCMWGSETDFVREGCSAGIISLKKDSKLSDELLIEILNSPPLPGTTCWGKDMFARLYRRYKFDIMPSSFFTIEWCINSHTRGLGDKIESTWFKKPIEDEKHLFLDSFAWHWSNSSKKNEIVEPGSKFDLLTKITDQRLKKIGF
jgi:hypothetical protein